MNARLSQKRNSSREIQMWSRLCFFYVDSLELSWIKMSEAALPFLQLNKKALGLWCCCTYCNYSIALREMDAIFSAHLPQISFHARGIDPWTRGSICSFGFSWRRPFILFPKVCATAAKTGRVPSVPSPNSSRRILPDVEKLPHLFRPSTVWRYLEDLGRRGKCSWHGRAVPFGYTDHWAQTSGTITRSRFRVWERGLWVGHDHSCDFSADLLREQKHSKDTFGDGLTAFYLFFALHHMLTSIVPSQHISQDSSGGHGDGYLKVLQEMTMCFRFKMNCLLE